MAENASVQVEVHRQLITLQLQGEVRAPAAAKRVVVPHAVELDFLILEESRDCTNWDTGDTATNSVHRRIGHKDRHPGQQNKTSDHDGDR